MLNGYITEELVDTQTRKTGGAETVFDLSKMQSYKGQGYGRAVAGFKIAPPTGSVPITALKRFDGITMAMFYARLTFHLSPKSPPYKFPGGHQLWTGMEGAALFDCLMYRSNLPVIVGAGQSTAIAAAGATDALTTVAFGSSAALFRQDSSAGWLQFLGSFAEGDAGGGTFLDVPHVFLPCGVVWNESLGDTTIPNHWMNGQLGQAGVFKVSLATTVDTCAVTWTAGDIEVRAIEYAYPLNKTPSPNVVHIEQYSLQGKNLSARAGIRRLLVLRKELVSDAPPTHSYTTVDVYRRGDPIIDSTVANNIITQGRLTQREAFRWTRLETTMTANQATARQTRNGVPLLCWDGEATLSPSDTEMDIKVIITSTGETGAHTLLDMTDIPRDEHVAMEAVNTNLTPATVSGHVSGARNGNLVPAFIRKLIPGKVVTPLPTATVAMASSGK